MRECLTGREKDPEALAEMWWVQKRIFGKNLFDWIERILKSWMTRGTFSVGQVILEVLRVWFHMKPIIQKIIKNGLEHNNMHAKNWLIKPVTFNQEENITISNSPGFKLYLVGWGMSTFKSQRDIPKVLFEDQRFKESNQSRRKELKREAKENLHLKTILEKSVIENLLENWAKICYLVIISPGEWNPKSQKQQDEIRKIFHLFQSQYEQQKQEKQNDISKMWSYIATATYRFLTEHLKKSI